jgi:hypothetical protein
VAETRLGVSLEGTRLHTSSGAQAKAANEGALAVTEGTDIAFAADRLDTRTTEGRALLGHELVHVAQQQGQGASRKQRKVGDKKSGIELIRDILGRRARGASTTSDDFDLQSAWASLGEKLPETASQNWRLWEQTEEQFPHVTSGLLTPYASRLRQDVLSIARGNLEKNRGAVLAEMLSLGLGPDEDLRGELGQELVTPTEQEKDPLKEGQDAHLVQTQDAAAQVATMVRQRRDLQRIIVGYGTVPTTGTDTAFEAPVFFDPERRPDATEPASGASERPGVKSWSELKRQDDALVNTISEWAADYPGVFALLQVGSGLGAQSGALETFAEQASPEEARAILARAFAKLLADIKGTEESLGSTIDPMDLSPIIDRLEQGKATDSAGFKWNSRFGKAVVARSKRGREAAEDQGPAAASVLFLVAGLETGGVAVLLAAAGAAVTGADVLAKVQKYQALATAEKTAVKPGTSLVDRQTVRESKTKALIAAVNALLAAALGIATRVVRAALAGRTGTVWDDILATQPVHPGTAIPRSFELTTRSGRIWVHGHATKHLEEYARAMLARGVSRRMVDLATQQQLSSLQAAVQAATANGVPYGRLVTVGGWELKFAAPRAAGELPVLIHALPR